MRVAMAMDLSELTQNVIRFARDQTRASHRLGSAGVAALFDHRLWPTAGEVTGDLIAGRSSWFARK